MLRRFCVLCALFACSAVAAGAEGARVAYVIDGDTVALTSGMRVRLLQIDTPELGTGECYSRAAAKALRRLVPPGSEVALESDARLGSTDRYGRALRYLRRNGTNVNVELVRVGAATVWLYDGVRGKYANSLLAAARDARRHRRGLWGACSARWDPYAPATTTPTQ